MKVLKDFVPLFTAGIFFVGFLALLLTGFGYMLKPIEKRIDRLEAGQAKLETRMTNLETGQVKLEKRIDGIEVKLDTLLELIKKQ